MRGTLNFVHRLALERHITIPVLSSGLPTSLLRVVITDFLLSFCAGMGHLIYFIPCTCTHCVHCFSAVFEAVISDLVIGCFIYS